MASESIIQQLFQVAKSSLYFKGLNEDEIWKACLDYQNRSDEDIQIAIQNIQQEDKKILAEFQEKQNRLLQNKEKIISLKQEESFHRQEDQKNATDVLDNFFNS